MFDPFSTQSGVAAHRLIQRHAGRDGYGGAVRYRQATPVAQSAAKVVTPFTRAAVERREGPFIDESTTMTASSQAKGPHEVPANGYARAIVLEVTLSGGAAGMATVAANRDAPWNVLSDIAFLDTNGQPLVGPFNGFDLYLVNKWGGYAFSENPTDSPIYSAIDSDGDFTFTLRIPLEVIARNAYGALLNMNTASAYRLRYTIADAATVFSTEPDTLGSVRVRAWLDAWSRPSDVSPSGAPQETAPKSLGTTQFWSKSSKTLANGQNDVRLSRVGHFIRNLIVVTRDSSAVREGANVPDPISFFIDGQELRQEPPSVLRDEMAKRTGYTLASISTADFDEGVLVYGFTHDFDGHPGGEMGDLWLPSSSSSRIEVRGSWGAAGSLDIITNDVAPMGAAV